MHRIKERVIHGLFLFNGLLVVLVLAGIFFLLVQTSFPAFKEISLKNFFFSSIWNPDGYTSSSYGILSMIVSTIMVTAGALLVAIPLGIGTAAYLSDVASMRVREIAKPFN